MALGTGESTGRCGEEIAGDLRRQRRADLRRGRKVSDLCSPGRECAADGRDGAVPGRARRRRAQEVVRVVITGASSGIGEALARHYALAGNVLGLISRRPANVQGLAGTAVPYSVDVTDTRALEQAASDFIARFGAPDLVIANAGIGVGTSSEDLRDMELLRRTLEVNVVGLAATLAAFAPSMRKAGHGTLAGICSVAGFRGLAGNGAYSGSKAAAITWLESLRTEMHGSGVAVVCICPGYIDTPLTRVNRFRMPFLLTVDEGARRIARAIARRPRLAGGPPSPLAVLAAGRRGRGAQRGSRRPPAAPRRRAVADGARFGGATTPAGLGLRPAGRQGAAEAAAEADWTYLKSCGAPDL